MADQVDPRTAASDFDGIESDELGSDPDFQRYTETRKRRDDQGKSGQVDPRQGYNEFDGIRSGG